MITGSLGRSGTGAIDCMQQCGIENLTKWDLDETKKGGPFPAIVEEHEIFVNCIYLNNPIPPFITKGTIYIDCVAIRTI